MNHVQTINYNQLFLMFSTIFDLPFLLQFFSAHLHPITLLLALILAENSSTLKTVDVPYVCMYVMSCPVCLSLSKTFLRYIMNSYSSLINVYVNNYKLIYCDFSSSKSVNGLHNKFTVILI